MFKIFRSLTFISKDEFDQALHLCTSSEDTNKPKDKHIALIIQCLKGEDQKVLPLDAFTRFYDVLAHITFNKWITALKVGYIFHLCLLSDCKVFVEAVCCNRLFDKIKTNLFKKSEEQPIVTIHTSIATCLYNYLQMRYENYLYFLNALADFDQKEEHQKIFIVHKIVHMIQVLVRMQKELDWSLEKFPNQQIVKYVCFQILSDLNYYYPIVEGFLKQRLQSILVMDYEHGTKLYSVYTDTLRLSRPISLILKLSKSIPIDCALPGFIMFTVDHSINREIELHFKVIPPQINTDKMDIIRFDDESLHDVECNSPPRLLLQQFQAQIIQKQPPIPMKTIILDDEPQPDDILYVKHNTIQTERQLPKKQRFMEQSTTSMQQSNVSTDNNSVRLTGLSRQSSVKTEFFAQSQSPLSFLNFTSSLHNNKKN